MYIKELKSLVTRCGVFHVLPHGKAKGPIWCAGKRLLRICILFGFWGGLKRETTTVGVFKGLLTMLLATGMYLDAFKF